MLTLVLGGTRSGKSEIAEQLVTALEPPVTYLATGSAGQDDPDFAARIAKHRARRPASWVTVEPGADLAGAVVAHPNGTMLIDALGTWMAGQLGDPATGALDIDDVVTAMVSALVARLGPTVVVSEEVGLSVHAPTEAGRRFVDAMGQLNRAVATRADDVLLVVAGRMLRLEPFPLG